MNIDHIFIKLKESEGEESLAGKIMGFRIRGTMVLALSPASKRTCLVPSGHAFSHEVKSQVTKETPT